MITYLVNNVANVANVTQTNLISSSNQVKIIEAANLLDYYFLANDLTIQVSSAAAGITAIPVK